MRLNEISDEEKLFLTLKGIEYDFVDRYETICQAALIIGKSSHRQNLLKSTIDETCLLINVFFEEGFDINDPDIVSTKDIYNKLLDIKNKL